MKQKPQLRSTGRPEEGALTPCDKSGSRASLIARLVKNPPALQGTPG